MSRRNSRDKFSEKLRTAVMVRQRRFASKTSISANFIDDPAEVELDAETFSTKKAILWLPLIESKEMRHFLIWETGIIEIRKHITL